MYHFPLKCSYKKHILSITQLISDIFGRDSVQGQIEILLTRLKFFQYLVVIIYYKNIFCICIHHSYLKENKIFGFYPLLWNVNFDNRISPLKN